MKTVSVISNYTYPPIIRQSPDENGVWGDFQFYFEPIPEADYLIVLNYPLEDISMRVRKGGKILVMQEPPYHRNEYYKFFFKYFDTVISHFSPKLKSKQLAMPPFLPWLVDGTYNDFLLNDFFKNKEHNLPVWVTSNAVVNPGHQPRLDFISFLQEKKFPFELWGRGFRPIDDKFQVFQSAKYTIAVENYIDNDYFTEKIIDPILMGCHVFYAGCINLDKYLPAGSFTPIDLKDFEKSLLIMERKIAEDAWASGYSDTLKAKGKILNELQFFPGMTALMDNIHVEEMEQVFIPSDPSKHLSFFEKIKRKFF